MPVLESTVQYRKEHLIAQYLDGMPVRAAVDRYLWQLCPGSGGGSDSSCRCRTRCCVRFILHSCAAFVQPGRIEIEADRIMGNFQMAKFVGFAIT